MRSRATILLYHGIGLCPSGPQPHLCINIRPEVFARQMDFLSRHRRVIPLADLLAEPQGPASGPPTVALTFDDGFRSVLTEALPMLRRLMLPASVFVPTRWIGSANGWMAGSTCYPLPLMTEDDLREVDRGGISVESHGHEHIDMSAVPDDVVRDDLRASVDIIERVVGGRPRYLAYPFGTHSQQAEAIAAQSGFAAVLTAFQAGAGGTPDFAHERVDMDGHESTLRLALKTRGGYLAMRRSRAGTTAAAAVRRVVRGAVESRSG